MSENTGDDYEVSHLAIAAIASVLGPQDESTQKIARWERADLVVNVHRQHRRSATIWIAGARIVTQGQLQLSSLTILPGTPPKSSNCSAAVKGGPTLFAYASTSQDFATLTEFLTRLHEGNDMTTLVENDDFDEEDDDVALDLAATERQVLTQALDERVEGLVSRIRRGRLILQPDFQRDFVWSKPKSGRLIESILMRIPLPVVYVAELDDGKWEVVDGQQRLTSIQAFIDGKFPDGEDFRLGKLKVRPDLRGKGFTDLSAADQGAIEDYTLRVIKIMKEAHPDLKFEVFERLNSGADKLNDMELRNCIYRGSYNNLLEELTSNENLLRIRGADAPDTRMKDRQLILRFFAMTRSTHLNYKAPMKQFMNHEMQKHRDADTAAIAEMRRKFKDAIQCAWDVFGEHAFRRYSVEGATSSRGSWDVAGKLNVALWDTILYTFTFFERRQIVQAADAIFEEFLDLMTNDATFGDYIGRTTDQPDRVRYRAETWRKRLDDVIRVPAGETRAFTKQLKANLYAANSSCAICSQHIQQVDDAEVDHVEHYWRGGRTIPANARLTHRFCNRSRGGR